MNTSTIVFNQRIAFIIGTFLLLFGIGSACGVSDASAGIYKYEKDGKIYYADSVPLDAKSIVKLVRMLPDSEPRLLYPKSYYPQPEPRHYPSTGAVCWKTLQGPWECKAGKPADKIRINLDTGSGFPFGVNNSRLGHGHGKKVKHKRR